MKNHLKWINQKLLHWLNMNRIKDCMRKWILMKEFHQVFKIEARIQMITIKTNLLVELLNKKDLLVIITFENNFKIQKIWPGKIQKIPIFKIESKSTSMKPKTHLQTKVNFKTFLQEVPGWEAKWQTPLSHQLLHGNKSTVFITFQKHMCHHSWKMRQTRWERWPTNHHHRK